MTKNPVLLTEYARQAIRRLLIKPYLNSSGELPSYLLDTTIEQAIEGTMERRIGEPFESGAAASARHCGSHRAGGGSGGGSDGADDELGGTLFSKTGN